MYIKFSFDFDHSLSSWTFFRGVGGWFVMSRSSPSLSSISCLKCNQLFQEVWNSPGSVLKIAKSPTTVAMQMKVIARANTALWLVNSQVCHCHGCSIFCHITCFSLQKLTLWFRNNVLSLNVLKTNYIHFRDRKSNDSLALNIFKNRCLFFSTERKTCTKFLGVYTNEKLDWSDHVKHIVTSISRNNGILYRIIVLLLI